jgi:hypothetical protein
MDENPYSPPQRHQPAFAWRLPSTFPIAAVPILLALAMVLLVVFVNVVHVVRNVNNVPAPPPKAAPPASP